MCIIAIKKSGVDMPTKETLQNCFDNNPDGCGFMYRKGSQVVIDKGYFDFDQFYKQLMRKNFSKKDTVIFHFRIATHGAITAAQCHPFPVSKNERELGLRNYQTDMAMVHNGMLSAMPKHKTLSDTMLFVRDVLADDAIRPNLHRTAVQLLIQEATIGSKLAVLTKDSLTLYGKFISDFGGLLFSNDTYLNSGYSNMAWVREYNRKKAVEFSDWPEDREIDMQDELEAFEEFLADYTEEGVCTHCGNDWRACDCGTIAHELNYQFSTNFLDYLSGEVLTKDDALSLQLYSL